MDVEGIAVNAITGVVNRCPHLKAYISLNDKTPFTDGHIDLYDSMKQTKKDWIGRVSVQVKGRSRTSKKALSQFAVSRTELIAFQRDSGVLYFVVTVNPKGQPAAFYAPLSPFAIQGLLNDSPAGKSNVQVPMKPLPNDPKKVEGIVALALKSRDQNMSLGFDPIVLDKLDGFSIFSAADLTMGTEPLSVSSMTGEHALVLHTTDGLSIPVAGTFQLLPSDYVERRIKFPIQSGTVRYDRPLIRRLDDQRFILGLSEGLSLTVEEQPEHLAINVSLTLEGGLSERLKALQFFIALSDTKRIEIGGETSTFDFGGTGDEDWPRRHLTDLKMIAELCETLGVNTSLIDVTQIGPEQARQLARLRRVIAGVDEFTHDSDGIAGVAQPIGQWQLMLLKVPGEVAGSWRLENPFSAEVRRQFLWRADTTDGPETIPTTAYEVLEDDRFGQVLNLGLDEIVGAYAAISDFESTYELATQRVLALIRAADEVEQRRDEFLDAATRLNDWLIDEQPEQPHHMVNRWQVTCRRGSLSEEQRTDIRQMRRLAVRGEAGGNPDTADLLEVACAILLGDAEEVGDLANQLAPDRLELLQGWPIWRITEIGAGRVT